MTEHLDPLTEPTGQRRRLGALLGRLRQATGLSQTEFGGRAGRMNQSKVSRLETGRQVPTEDDLRAWANAAQVDEAMRQQLTEYHKAALVEAAGWDDELRHGFAMKQARTGRAERTAGVVRAYSLIVPGLLQTAEYARRLIRMQAPLHRGLFGDIADALAAWMDRQQVLYQPGGRYEFLIPEAALRWRPGADADAVLVAQLHHLLAMAARSTVVLGVIPERTGATVCVPHEFTILGEPGDTEAEVAIYTTTRELHIRESAEIATYLELWTMLHSEAVFNDAAHGLIGDLITTLGG